MKTKEVQQKLIANMKAWQKIKEQSIAQADEIIAQTGNPIIQLVMEIVKADAQNHHRTQELIIQSMEGTISITPDEVGDIWQMIDSHIEGEKEVEALGRESLEAIQGKRMVVQEYLLNYLMADDSKHDDLLNNLSIVKGSMYPYG